MNSLLKLVLLVTVFVSSAFAQKEQEKAKMDEHMKAIQKMLMDAEAGGKADKPMMIKNVGGKMVMEPIPEDIMANFVFPDQLDKDDI